MQVEYSPFFTEIENPAIGLLETCRELGVAIVAYSPLGHGILSGVYRSLADFEEDDFRHVLPMFSEANMPKNLELVDGIGKIAKRKGCTLSQLTLAWMLAQGEDIIPIPGTKKIKYLEENLGALDLVLSVEDVAEVRAIIEGGKVQGARLPEVFLKNVFADTPELETTT